MSDTFQSQLKEYYLVIASFVDGIFLVQSADAFGIPLIHSF